MCVFLFSKKTFSFINMACLVLGPKFMHSFLKVAVVSAIHMEREGFKSIQISESGIKRLFRLS